MFGDLEAEDIAIRREVSLFTEIYPNYFLKIVSNSLKAKEKMLAIKRKSGKEMEDLYKVETD